jgi:hypothetical protein
MPVPNHVARWIDEQNQSRIVIEGLEKARPFDQRTAGVPINPDYLLNHENRFDPNVYTPEQMKVRQSDPIKRI